MSLWKSWQMEKEAMPSRQPVKSKPPKFERWWYWFWSQALELAKSILYNYFLEAERAWKYEEEKISLVFSVQIWNTQMDQNLDIRMNVELVLGTKWTQHINCPRLNAFKAKRWLLAGLRRFFSEKECRLNIVQPQQRDHHDQSCLFSFCKILSGKALPAKIPPWWELSMMIRVGFCQWPNCWITTNAYHWPFPIRVVSLADENLVANYYHDHHHDHWSSSSPSSLSPSSWLCYISTVSVHCPDPQTENDHQAWHWKVSSLMHCH